MKASRLLLLTFAAGFAAAQQTAAPPPETIPLDNPGGFNPVTLASQFFEHDFFNLYAFANGVYDTYAPTYNANGLASNGSFGWDAGGGVQVVHQFHNGSFSLGYRGDYRNYQSSAYSSGTNQSLSLNYSKRLSRHWYVSAGVDGGIFLYGTTFFAPETSSTTLVPTNPFSAETKFLSTYVSTTFQQTRRLSYSLSGNYFLNRYNYVGAVNSFGLTGTGSVNYRITPRSTIGVYYSHSYFQYAGTVGQADTDSVGGTYSRSFPNHWAVSVSGGFTQSRVSGTISVPITLITGNGTAVGGYLVGPYNQTSNFPSFSGTVSHNYRKAVLSVSAGQSIAAGNGYYLASRDEYINGLFSRTLGSRRSIASIGGGYFRLKSLANSVNTQYSSASLTASYGLTLYRYFGASFSYSYIYYGNLSPYPGVNDNRFTFGFTFSSRSIPLTMF